MDNNNFENNTGYTNPYDYSSQDIPATKAALKAMKKAKRAEKKNARKQAKGNKPNWGFRIAASAVSAVVLGAVAGVTCYGVSYAGYTLFPIKNANQVVNQTYTPPVTHVSNTTGSVNINANVMDVSEVVSSVIASVVAIDGTTTVTQSFGFFGQQTYESAVSGSGIIIGTNDSELLIVTNAHVVDGVNNLKITTYDGSSIDAKVKGLKTSYDLAVIAVELKDIPSDAIYTIAALAESSEIKVGEAAIAVGNSMGEGISVTTGVVSALNKTVTVENVDYKSLIQTDAAINPGNSGGALFNAKGEVIGINSVKMSDTGVEGMGYAISISSVKDIISDLSINDTRVKLSDEERGYLGISGVSITDEISKAYGYPIGVLVRSISENSAAQNAGIIKNDIISAFDGEEIESIEQLVEIMSYYAVGEEVEVKYYHMNGVGEYEEQTVTVKLTEKVN